MAKASKKRGARGGRDPRNQQTQTSGPSVGLVTIVRDEEEMLPRCLESVKGVVDEMVIVDTGSTDRTVEIAREFGAKVVEFEWVDDFAAARNFGLDHSTSDWVLHLDADEELISTRKSLRKTLKNVGDIDIFTVNIVVAPDVVAASENPGDTFRASRLFRRSYPIRYHGPIHEHVIGQAGRLCESPISILHFGPDHDGPAEEMERQERNLRILHDALKKDPSNVYLTSKMGDQYYRAHDWKKASKYLQIVEKSEGSNAEMESYVIEARRNLITCLFQLKHEDTAMSLLKGLQTQFPVFTDLFFIEGVAYIDKGDIATGRQLLEKCISMGDPPAVFPSIGGAGSWRAEALLSKLTTSSG